MIFSLATMRGENDWLDTAVILVVVVTSTSGWKIVCRPKSSC